MIEYLEQLVTEGQYAKALEFAEHLLLRQENSLEEILRINCAMASSRLELGEYHGAVVSGELAIRLSFDLELWDYYGKANFLTGAAHLFLRQPEEALTMCLAFLGKFQEYNTAREYETVVWYNLGFAHMALNDIPAAKQAYRRSLEAAKQLRDGRKEHGVRQGLIYLYLKTREFNAIPHLLAQSASFLRKNPEAAEWRNSWLWHLLLRAEFALLTNRLARAEAIASRGVRVAAKAPHQRFHFHMVLARIAHRGSLHKEAMGHSLAARVCAMSCHRYDLESEAGDLMYMITKADPAALRDLDQKYITDLLYAATYFPGR